MEARAVFMFSLAHVMDGDCACPPGQAVQQPGNIAPPGGRVAKVRLCGCALLRESSGFEAGARLAAAKELREEGCADYVNPGTLRQERA